MLRGVDIKQERGAAIRVRVAPALYCCPTAAAAVAGCFSVATTPTRHFRRRYCTKGERSTRRRFSADVRIKIRTGWIEERRTAGDVGGGR